MSPYAADGRGVAGRRGRRDMARRCRSGNGPSASAASSRPLCRGASIAAARRTEGQSGADLPHAPADPSTNTDPSLAPARCRGNGWALKPLVRQSPGHCQRQPSTPGNPSDPFDLLPDWQPVLHHNAKPALRHPGLRQIEAEIDRRLLLQTTTGQTSRNTAPGLYTQTIIGSPRGVGESISGEYQPHARS